MKTNTYLVTGGTTGIGLETAKLLASEGARVIVTGRNPATLAAVKAQLPSNAVVLASDSGSAAEAQALGQLVAQHTDRLDGAFLNAGIAKFAPFEHSTAELFDETYAINVRGPFLQLQSLLPLLKAPSSVVLNASVVAELGLQAVSVYSASKAAVVSLGKTLAVELAPRGIRVNTVSPGPVATPIFGKTGMSESDQKGATDSLAAQTLVKRMGQSIEIARAVRFLLSPESSFVVGDNLTVDGGVRLT